MASDTEKAGGTEAEHVEALSTCRENRASAAARQAAFEKGLTFWQTIRMFWRSTLWVLYGQIIVFGYGIDGIIAGQLLAIPRFREVYGHQLGEGETAQYIIPATWQSIYGGVSQLAAIVGAATTGWMADKVGRRWTNLFFCGVSIVGVAIQYVSTYSGSLGTLTAGKTVNGFAVGAWLVIGPLYASEVASIKLRGWLTAMTNIVQFCGVLVFTGIMYDLGPRNDVAAYEIPLACQWAVPVFVILTAWVWPESPVWLVRKQRHDDAQKSLRRLHGTSPDIDRDAILALIEQTVEEEQRCHAQNKNASYADCFTVDSRSRTLICMFVYGCQYLSGLVFILGYQTYFFQLAGFSSKKSFLFSMLNNVSMFVANILSWPFLNTIGRRPLIVWGQLACAITLLIIGGASLPGTTTAYKVTIAFIFAWGFIYQFTLGTVAWTVVAEIPSFRLRSRTQGLANIVLCVVQWVVGFVFPYMFNPDAGNLGGRVGFIFGTTTLLGFLGCWLWLPETKDRTVAELNRLYSERISPRHFGRVDLDAIDRDNEVEK